MQRVAFLSMHTSPLAQAGVGDGGGMNVYVRELVSALASSGVMCTTYTRAWRDGLPEEVEIEPNHRVVHVRAGAFDMSKEALPSVVDAFTDGVEAHLSRGDGADIVHANYWLSGLAGHRLKHRLDLPLVTTFHTLARVKTAAGDREPVARERAELEVIGCSDAICVSCDEERGQFEELYGAAPGTIEVVSPGVERAFFSPGDRGGARRALGLDDAPLLLVVGRIQPLKGVDVAVRALAEVHDRRTRLVIVGGASGPNGTSEMRAVRELVAALGLEDRVRFVSPLAHHVLSTWYRAADVVLVPSRSESFGLVALEAAACGVPVVASAVGGLRSLVVDATTGFLVESRDPRGFASRVDRLLSDTMSATAMGVAAAERARGYTWSAAAAKVRRVYSAARDRGLVACG